MAEKKDWSSSGIIMDRADVETQLGDRLRHNQYADRFGDDIAAESLRAELAEGLPSVLVQSARVLREWYAKYHPEAGPEHYANALELEAAYGSELRETPYAQVKGYKALKKVLSQRLRPVLVSEHTCNTWISTYGTLRYATADALEAALGPELRAAPYAGIGGKALRAALLQRAEPVDVTVKVCRTWCDKYGAVARPSRKRPAAAPASGIHKRAASARAVMEPEADGLA